MHYATWTQISFDKNCLLITVPDACVLMSPYTNESQDCAAL